jgi:hypothetical protein
MGSKTAFLFLFSDSFFFPFFFSAFCYLLCWVFLISFFHFGAALGSSLFNKWLATAMVFCCMCLFLHWEFQTLLRNFDACCCVDVGMCCLCHGISFGGHFFCSEKSYLGVSYIRSRYIHVGTDFLLLQPWHKYTWLRPFDRHLFIPFVERGIWHEWSAVTPWALSSGMESLHM